MDTTNTVRFNFTNKFNDKANEELNSLINDPNKCKKLTSDQWIKLVHKFYTRPMRKLISRINIDLFNIDHKTPDAKPIKRIDIANSMDITMYDNWAEEFIDNIKCVMSNNSDIRKYFIYEILKVIKRIYDFDHWHIYTILSYCIGESKCWRAYEGHWVFDRIEIKAKDNIDLKLSDGYYYYDNLGNINIKSKILYDPNDTKKDYNEIMKVLYSYSNLKESLKILDGHFYPIPEIVALVVIIHLFLRTYRYKE